jgi:Glycosyl-transferase for dystroglycan
MLLRPTSDEIVPFRTSASLIVRKSYSQIWRLKTPCRCLQKLWIFILFAMLVPWACRSLRSRLPSATGFSGMSSRRGRYALDCTLVTTATLERMWIFHQIYEQWGGKIVLVLYSDEKHPGGYFDERVHIEVIHVSGTGNPISIPINKLRNVGIRLVTTSHYLVIDIDFLPSSDLHSIISKMYNDRRTNLRSTRTAIVIPAFQLSLPSARTCLGSAGTHVSNPQGELSPECLRNHSKIPRLRRELHVCVLAGHCETFNVHENPLGHSSTRQWEWLAKPLTNEEMDPVRCFQSFNYEPYVVLPHADTTPIYDERFVGYGKNKIQQIAHLHCAGFEFSILPNGFILHVPHPKSLAKQTWEETSRAHRIRMNLLFEQNVAELKSSGKCVPVVPVCNASNVHRVRDLIAVSSVQYAR